MFVISIVYHKSTKKNVIMLMSIVHNTICKIIIRQIILMWLHNYSSPLLLNLIRSHMTWWIKLTCMSRSNMRTSPPHHQSATWHIVSSLVVHTCPFNSLLFMFCFSHLSRMIFVLLLCVLLSFVNFPIVDLFFLSSFPAS